MTRRFSFCVAIAVLALACGCVTANAAHASCKAYDTVALEEALANANVDASIKEKFQWVIDIRDFAVRRMRLAKTDSYGVFGGESSEPPKYKVVASKKDSLEPADWTYAGTKARHWLFDTEAEAEAERRKIEAAGFDAHVRPAPAFSTKGSCTEPVTPSMLELDEGRLAALLLHEIAHATASSAANDTFTESFAEFVGERGAMEYLEEKYGPGNSQARRMQDAFQDSRTFDSFFRRFAGRLDAFYKSAPADVIAGRAALFAEARREYRSRKPLFKAYSFDWFDRDDLNNAIILDHLPYANVEPFEWAFIAVGGDWERFIAVVRRGANDPDEFLARRGQLPPDKK